MKFSCSSGIWDCLSSQQVVDFVRLHVSQGKDLAETAELLCDHCLAPDTSSNAGIGCDNMTVLIVALLHGRTKEEWQAWITDRVEQGHGYVTPITVPQLYAMSRLLSFRARHDAQKARERARLEQAQQQNQEDDDGDDDDDDGPNSTPGGFYPRIMGSSGGISFHPGSEIMNRPLIFIDNLDSDDDVSDDERGADNSAGDRSKNLAEVDLTKVTLGLDNLKSCLEDLKDEETVIGEGSDRAGNLKNDHDADGDAHMEGLDDHHDRDGGEIDDDVRSRKTPVNSLQSDILASSLISLPNGDLKATERFKSPVELVASEG